MKISSFKTEQKHILPSNGNNTPRNPSFPKKIYTLTGIQDFSNCYEEYTKKDYKSSIKYFLIGSIKLAIISTLFYASYQVLSPSNSPQKVHRKLFVNSNERGMASIEESLRNNSFTKKGCHVGVSAWHNYDIAATTHPEKLIIADFAQVTHDFHATSIQLLKKCRTREEFISQMASRLLQSSNGPITEKNFKDHFQFIIWENDQPVKLEDRHPQISAGNLYNIILDALKMEMSRSGSWLSSVSRFQYIQSLAKQDNIVTHHVHLTDQTSFQSFSTKLNQICSRVNTIYLSNAQDWIHSSSALKQYIENIRSIINNQSLVIDASINGDYIYQKITSGIKWNLQQQ